MNLHSVAKLINLQLSMHPVGAHAHQTLSTTPVTLTPPVGAVKLMFQPTGTVPVFYTYDGTDPTSTKGFIAKDGMPPVVVPTFAGGTIRLVAASSTTVDYQWFGLPV